MPVQCHILLPLCPQPVCILLLFSWSRKGTACCTLCLSTGVGRPIFHVNCTHDEGLDFKRHACSQRLQSPADAWHKAVCVCGNANTRVQECLQRDQLEACGYLGPRDIPPDSEDEDDDEGEVWQAEDVPWAEGVGLAGVGARAGAAGPTAAVGPDAEAMEVEGGEGARCETHGLFKAP